MMVIPNRLKGWPSTSQALTFPSPAMAMNHPREEWHENHELIQQFFVYLDQPIDQQIQNLPVKTVETPCC